ncbi:MAG: SCO family protein [Limnohabitans sp.]
MIKRSVLGVIMALAWLVGGPLLSGCSADKPSFRGVDITGADYAKGWQLADQHGAIRTLQDFSGKVVVVFFGFTQCPDVCPTTLQELGEVKRLLGSEGERLQAVFITVDPDRDTPELLKAYMGNFDPAFVALRPTPEQLPALLKDFKIYAKKVAGPTATSYSMDHSAQSYLYDPQGRLRLYNRYGSGAQAVAYDARLLLKGL